MYRVYSNVFMLITVTILHPLNAREWSKAQQDNHNADFLLHESGSAGGYKPDLAQFPPLNSQSSKSPNLFQSSDFPPLNPATNKKENSNGRRDYVAPNRQQTPSPSSQSTTSPLSPTPKPSPKRDYVAPQIPAKPTPASSAAQSTSHMPVTPSSPSSNGKRDYVAPQKPTVKPPSTLNTQSTILPPSSTTSGKRDYVAPNWPALPPSSGATSPSDKLTPTPKPLSFSDIVSGSNKPSSPSPTTRRPLSVTTFNSVVPTPKGSTRSPVLPSSIVNKGNNNNKKDGPSDAELQNLSEELLRKDTNNAAKHITVNYQEKTTSHSKDDKAAQPLFSVPDNVWNMPTIQKFVPLLDNYEWDTLINEHVTPQERIEENSFMDAIMSTSVIRYLMNFLKEKGYVTPDPKQQRDFLKQLWFNLYSRGKGKIGSSGFEHIFVSELKNGQVSGLHNWIYFAKQEAINKVNYLGYLKYSQFNDKGAVLKFHFNQQGVDKPVDTMFIGTSPELEMALYTLCFVTRADNDCNLKLGGKNINIVSHTFRYRSKNLIGSAYPEIMN